MSFNIYASGPLVLSCGSGERMEQCDHEEADSRMCVHLKDALDKDARSILVRTVDTDVIVILTGLFFHLYPAYPGLDIWVAFGMGKYFQYISVNTICMHLGVEKSLALPSFHAYTGCDTTSQFRSKGKKSCWEAWKVYPEVTEAFINMVAQPISPLESTCTLFELLERFTCILYDKTTSVVTVNDLRKELFSKGSLSMENIPPTQVI